MVHLLAAMANDAEHMPALLYTLRGVLVPPAPIAGGETWGIGYYADDQALTIRKPGELVGGRSFFELGSSVKSRVLIALLQRGHARAHQAPPYRFRRWLFGTIGDLSALGAARQRILEATPEFIRSELGEAGPGELVFGMFLRELQARNLLNDPLVSPPALAGALARAQEAVAMLRAETGAEGPGPGLVATNGRVILASRGKAGPELCWQIREGLELPSDAPVKPVSSDPMKLAESLKRFRAFVLSAGQGAPARDFSLVPEASTIWVDRNLVVTPL